MLARAGGARPGPGGPGHGLTGKLTRTVTVTLTARPQHDAAVSIRVFRRMPARRDAATLTIRPRDGGAGDSDSEAGVTVTVTVAAAARRLGLRASRALHGGCQYTAHRRCAVHSESGRASRSRLGGRRIMMGPGKSESSPAG